MFSFAFITGLAFLSTTGWAQYVLEDDYTSNGNFFDQFNFFNDSDPTHGFVDYVDKDYAWNAGLIGNDYGKVYMGVDHTGIASKHGRPAVRIESTKTYDSGLVIIDIEHMPGGICGTWPAFWMVGPDWPDNGEIDILEGVNDQTCNDMTLHTGPGCSISRHTDMLASVSTDNCDVKAEGQSDNQGCQIKTDDPRSYGKGFNDNGGGVYATEIMESFINIFFFPRGSIPSDISSSSPDPSSWGKPTAVFMGDCDIAQTFKKMQLVFTNTFCGDWAGNTWDQSSCASKADSCDDYVQNNPEAFEDAYWSVNSLRVYKHGKPYVSSTATTSERTSSKMSHTAPVPYSSEASNSSMTSLVYSTKGTGIPMPSGVPEYGPYGGNYGNSGKGASPTAAAEASQGYGLVPSHLLPTNVRVAATGTAAAVAAEMSTQARQRPEGWQWRGSSRHRHHGGEKTARHLRQHKRHGGRGH